MSRPWMKWYPRDWRADPRLRMCSLAARGLWMELIGFMHEAEPYGHLLIDGKQPAAADIAALVGRPLAEIRKALAELDERGVYSLTDDDVIFSRRMVRDADRSEEGRKQVEKRWGDREPNRSPNRSGDKTPTTQKPDTRKKEDGGGDARASLISPEAMALTTEIAAIVGYPTPDHWPPGWCGAPYRVETMLQGGWQREIILASTREIMAKRGNDPPDGIKYFEKAFARAHAEQNAPLPEIKLKPAEVVHAETSRRNSQGRNGITAALERQRQQFEGELSDGESLRDPPPRLIPHG
jgi:hypothetical protein